MGKLGQTWLGMGKLGQTWPSKNMFRSQLDTFIDVREVPGENKNKRSQLENL